MAWKRVTKPSRMTFTRGNKLANTRHSSCASIERRIPQRVTDVSRQPVVIEAKLIVGPNAQRECYRGANNIVLKRECETSEQERPAQPPRI